MMTSSSIRQSFLDFFKEKKHTIVPSSPLLPDAPNLLFTNAGMNQFVPIFLGQTPCPYSPPRAADTQKCIRAGGKHNDLDDVGFDTYHHTLFEMLGNWSFGDYFKAEAIAWAWELVAGRWGFPKSRIYATIYKPGPGDPAAFDQEAYDLWADLFRKAGLDPEIHIVYGNKKDNFWSMGETGPCGPCSELHIDLTPGEIELSLDRQRAGALLVNTGVADCIEIWNLVFIQFNAAPGGVYSELPARHVDTGMGFERVASIIQGTKNFTDFKNARISNYETDVFRPLFTALEKITGHTYTSTLPAQRSNLARQEKIDVAFRVIADHIRTVSFAIADGISPSNTERGYVVRRILRRAIRYGNQIGCTQPFMAQLVPVLVEQMAEVFPELKTHQQLIESTILREEQDFRRTIQRGEELFRKTFDQLQSASTPNSTKVFPGDVAFKLYDTYGFPLDLTMLMAQEQGWSVDETEFNTLMKRQKELSAENQTTEVITVSQGSALAEVRPTHFTGFEELQTASVVLYADEKTLVTAETPFYAELGGQLGDMGELELGGKRIAVTNTVRAEGVAGVTIHRLAEPVTASKGERVTLHVDAERRLRIEAHHSATHILHWALRRLLGPSVVQRGSYVGPDRLRFDFAHSSPLTPEQLTELHQLIHEKITSGDAVSWAQRPYAEVKGDPAILQLFGDKYGDVVRVVSIGDYSKELCGGTHLRRSSETGYLRILSETGISAGVRRIEAVAGLALIEEARAAWNRLQEQLTPLRQRASELGLELGALPELPSVAKPESLLDTDFLWSTPKQQWNALETAETKFREAGASVAQLGKEQAKKQEAGWQSTAAEQVKLWIESSAAKPIATPTGDVPFLSHHIPDQPSGYLPSLADAMKARWKGVALLAVTEGEKVTLAAVSTPDYAKKLAAGKLIQAVAPLVGGKGGGRPDFAQGGGTNAAGIPAAFEQAQIWIKENNK